VKNSTFLQTAIYSNSIIGLSAACLSAGFLYDAGVGNWLIYGVFNFFSVLFVYNFQRIYKARFSKVRTPLLEWVLNNKGFVFYLLSISLLTCFALFTFLWQKNTALLLLFGAMVLLSLVYVVPLLGKSLRDLPHLKSPIIALVWVVVLFVFPCLNEGLSIRAHVGPVSIYFLFFLALTIPFDLRDLQIDSRKQKTLPMVLGEKGSRFLSIGLIFVYFIYFAVFNETLRYNVFFISSILFLSFLLFTSKRGKSEIYFACLDLCMLLIGLAYFL
jgi:hypothetical protein